jgi:hypothetical protein
MHLKMSNPQSSDADGRVKYRDTTRRFESPRYREKAIRAFDARFPLEKILFDGHWSTVADQEIHSINELSFVPTPTEIQMLNKTADLANTAIKNNNRTTLLSKLAKKEFSKTANLCPESLNPNDTVLVTNGKRIGQIVDYEETPRMTVLDDLVMTYENSWGPNGVLLECQDAKLYGTNRINLFYRDENLVKKLLRDYLRFRNDNIVDIFAQFVNSMDDRRENYQLSSANTTKHLADDLRPKYDLVCDMLRAVLTQAKFRPLKDLGMGVVSFCQTWMSKPGGIPKFETQFSIMSPHFQTRFHVVNDEKLKGVPGVRPEHLRAYSDMVAHCHKNQMVQNYKNAYVNLDELAEQLLASGPRKRPRRTDVPIRADHPKRTDSWSNYA